MVLPYCRILHATLSCSYVTYPFCRQTFRKLQLYFRVDLRRDPCHQSSMDQLMALPKESDMANRQLLEHLRHQDVLQNQDALHLGDCLPLAGVLPDVVDVVLVDEELLHRSAR